MGARIKEIEVFLPATILSNVHLSAEFGRWEPDKIENKLGIRERHIASNKETAGDLAYFAAEKLLKRFNKDKVNMLILCTQSPDYFLPTTACVLQDRLGLPTDIGAFDFNLGCSGFVYGLAMAKSFINTGIADNVLLITAETYSKHIHPKDLANRTIFGDGAAAVIIEKSDKEQIFEFTLGTDGSGYANLIVPNGGFRNVTNPHPEEIFNDAGDVFTENNLFMNGPEIFNFTIEAVPVVVEKCLIKNNMHMKDIDYVIFHQANKYMIEYLRKKIGIPKEKFYSDMLMTGNTVSATIPVAYFDSIKRGYLKRGNKVLLCGFGVGYSWGAVVIEI